MTFEDMVTRVAAVMAEDNQPWDSAAPSPGDYTVEARDLLARAGILVSVAPAQAVCDVTWNAAIDAALDQFQKATGQDYDMMSVTRGQTESDLYAAIRRLKRD